MLSSHNKTAKLIWGFVALSLVFIWGYQAWGEDKKPTVTLVWEKKMDMEYSFRNQYEYDQLAESYFKAQERILLGQVGEQENVIVVVPHQEVRFIDKQGKVIKKIPLQWDENLNPETGIGERKAAYLSPDGKYIGIARFTAEDLASTFELMDAAGNSLWQKKTETGSAYSNVLITSNANNVVLFRHAVEDFSGPPDSLQFFSKDGTLLKEYSKADLEMKKTWMDKQEKINVVFERAYEPKYFSQLDPNGDLILDKDISGFIPPDISASGEYYFLRKKEGGEIYDYLFNKEGVLMQKILVTGKSWLSPDGDFRGWEKDNTIQFISLSTGVPSFNFDSRRLPGEEKTNTIIISFSIHSSGQYLLLSLVKEKDGAPGWIVILNNDNKKIYQNTFPKGNTKADFAGNGKFIRVFNNAENKIMLYKFEN